VVILWGLSLAFPAAARTKPRKIAGITILDPIGDDNGPGTYTYPTDRAYERGSFDIVKFQIFPGEGTVEFHVTVNATIDDPWSSPSWGGNGFSVQMAFIHIDMDHEPGSGITHGLPGTNVRFNPDEAWEKAIILSPQGRRRVQAEVDRKAASWKEHIVIPRITRAEGRTLVAVVDVAALGGVPEPHWGYQVLMQSNEGFPDEGHLLTRKVERTASQHRFGGASDDESHPQVMDILVPPGGDVTRKQHKILSKSRKPTMKVKFEDLAVVPMVYPAAPQRPVR
jgi:carbohydrate-binding DOMON domain-containing protein